MLLKISDFLGGHRHGHLLLLLERLAFGHQAVVLAARLFIRHEGVDALTNGLHIGLLNNRLAELFGLLHHRSFFNHRLHNSIHHSTGIKARDYVRIAFTGCASSTPVSFWSNPWKR